MKTNTRKETTLEAAKKLSAASVIAGMLVSPTASFAGPLDALKATVQQASSKVTELKNNVQAKVEDVKDKIEDLDGEELMEAVRSMITFVKQTQAGYQQFVGANKCGAGTPCATFRNGLRTMVESFIKLPQEMPFMEHVPPAVQQLEQVAKLIDFLPPPILFASQKVLGNAFDEIKYRMDMLRYAVSQAPRLPTMAELSDASAKTSALRTTSTTASDRTSTVRTNTVASDRSSTSVRTTTSSAATTSSQAADFPWCSRQLSGKAGQELVVKSLEHLGDFLWDLGDLMGDDKFFVSTGFSGKEIKDPAKPFLQIPAFMIKTFRQVLEIKIAATAAICEARGYQAQ